MSTDSRNRAWIEVKAASLRRNLRRVRAAVGPAAPVIPMVKADAYGLGALHAVDALEREEPWAYGVAAVQEGRELRAHGVRRDVIVFSPLAPGEQERALGLELSVCISSLEALDELRAAAGHLGVAGDFHVEVDTGMGRAGFRDATVSEWGEVVRAVASSGALRWRGLFTHLHSADELGGPGVGEQVDRFAKVVEILRPPADCLLHVANSAGALRLAAGTPWVAARPGIFLYGGRVGTDLPEPEAVASVRARIVLVKDVPEGATAGYGATYRAASSERWATLAIGYGDGLPRALGNRGHAIVCGRRVPLVGRVSMDLTVANISGLDGVEAGDVATLLGCDGDVEIKVDEVAEQAGTISYEVLTGLTPRLPRVWIEDDDA